MKRIFPVIIVLISLSLIGLILFQINWFRAMTKLRQAQIFERAEHAGFDVATELSKQASYAPYMKIPQRPDLSLSPDPYNISLAKPLIAQHFSDFEVREKIQKSFEDIGLKDVNFEFAITKNALSYNIEMQSANFRKEVEDTVYNRINIIPIIPEGMGIIDGFVPYEHLILIIPKFKAQVWESNIWMILASGAFTLIMACGH